MNISKPIMAIMSFCFMSSIFAQEVEQLTKKDSIVQSYWLVTLGVNIVDDSGDEFGELFDLSEGWNMVPYPSRFSVGAYGNVCSYWLSRARWSCHGDDRNRHLFYPCRMDSSTVTGLY